MAQDREKAQIKHSCQTWKTASTLANHSKPKDESHKAKEIRLMSLIEAEEVQNPESQRKIYQSLTESLPSVSIRWPRKKAGQRRKFLTS